MTDGIDQLALILRFAAISQILLLGTLIVHAGWRQAVTIATVLYLTIVICHLLCPVVVDDWAFGDWAIPFRAGCYAGSAVFWVFTRAMFDDAFRFRAIHVCAIVGLMAVGFVHNHVARAVLAADHESASGVAFAVIPQILSLGFVILALAQAQLGRHTDLVEARRWFRDALVGISGAYIVIVLISEILVAGEGRVLWLEAVDAGVIFVIAFGFCLFSVRLRRGLFLRDPRPAGATAEVDPREAALLDALLDAVESQKIYRREGLTIAALAAHVSSQEYRVRRAINGRLGYRNFTAFLNHYRLQEACARLSDPAEARTPVLTIAMDLGYRSLGPFNRAFKDLTGVTPSAYRRSKRGGSGPEPGG